MTQLAKFTQTGEDLPSKQPVTIWVNPAHVVFVKAALGPSGAQKVGIWFEEGLRPSMVVDGDAEMVANRISDALSAP